MPLLKLLCLAAAFPTVNLLLMGVFLLTGSAAYLLRMPLKLKVHVGVTASGIK